MGENTSRMDFLVVATSWLTLSLVFLRLQDDWSWEILIPVMGFLWLCVPLVVTRFEIRPLLVVSATSLVVATCAFLLMVWTAVIILGGIGSLFFELEGKSGLEIATRLASTGLTVVPGAASGAVAGVAWRSRSARPGSTSQG